MLRKYSSIVVVLAAVLLLPVMAHASPVTFYGAVTGSSEGNSPFFVAPFFNVTSDTTVITTFDVMWFEISNPTEPAIYNATFAVGPIFQTPNFLNPGFNFHFTTIGTQAGVTFSVTQTGAENITLGGVDYFMTFNLSQLELLPGQRSFLRLTLTPVPEPTTMLLLGTGLAGIAAKVHKRRKAV